MGSMEPAQSSKELPTPDVDEDLSNTVTTDVEAVQRTVPIDDEIPVDVAESKLPESSSLEESVMVEPLRGNLGDSTAVLETVEDGSEETLVEEEELSEEVEIAEEVLDTELETILVSVLDSDGGSASIGADLLEAEDTVEVKDKVFVEPEETISTSGIKITLEPKETLQD